MVYSWKTSLGSDFSVMFFIIPICINEEQMLSEAMGPKVFSAVELVLNNRNRS